MLLSMKSVKLKCSYYFFILTNHMVWMVVITYHKYVDIVKKRLILWGVVAAAFCTEWILVLEYIS